MTTHFIKVERRILCVSIVQTSDAFHAINMSMTNRKESFVMDAVFGYTENVLK